MTHIYDNLPSVRRSVDKSDDLSSQEFWGGLREEWITTSISLAGLAEKYNLPFGVVKNKWLHGNWKDAKANYEIQVQANLEKVRAEKAKITAEKVKQCDDAALLISSRILETLDDCLFGIKSNNQRLQIEGKRRLLSLKEAAKILKNTQHVYRLVGGRPTDILGASGDGKYSDEELERIEKEIENVLPEPVKKSDIEKEIQGTVVSNQSSQDSQESTNNISE